MRTCPECGADRDGAVRFCPGCGLDYWRAAAGQPTHAQPPPVAVRPAASGRASHLIAAGVVLLVVAGGAAVVMAGVLPPGMPGGRTTPTARQLTREEAVIYAFFREVRDPRAAYTVTFEGRMTFAGIDDPPPPITSTGAFDLSGDDWAGSERLVQDEETILDVEVRLVDDVGYVSAAGGDWVSEEIPDRLQPISPFRRISTVTEVEYLAKTALDGRPQHSLLVTKWLGGRDFSDVLRGYARIESQESRLEVVVDAFGVPSVAELDLTVVARDGRDTVTISATVTYRIGSWDDVGPIEAPAPADAAAMATTER